MLMAALEQIQLDDLQTYVDTNDRAGYWQKLAEYQLLKGQDNSYALLALSVAQDKNISGRIANAYFRHVASEEGVTITPQDELNVGLDIMRQDLVARNDASGNDITVQVIEQYHVNAFDNVNVSINAWTAYAVLDVAGDNIWNKLTSMTTEDWLAIGNGVGNSATVALIMTGSAIAGNQTAQIWLDNLLLDGVLFNVFNEANPTIGSINDAITITGTESTETLIGNNQNNQIFGFEGNDTLGTL